MSNNTGLIAPAVFAPKAWRLLLPSFLADNGYGYFYLMYLKAKYLPKRPAFFSFSNKDFSTPPFNVTTYYDTWCEKNNETFSCFVPDLAANDGDLGVKLALPYACADVNLFNGNSTNQFNISVGNNSPVSLSSYFSPPPMPFNTTLCVDGSCVFRAGGNNSYYGFNPGKNYFMSPNSAIDAEICTQLSPQHAWAVRGFLPNATTVNCSDGLGFHVSANAQKFLQPEYIGCAAQSSLASAPFYQLGLDGHLIRSPQADFPVRNFTAGDDLSALWPENWTFYPQGELFDGWCAQSGNGAITNNVTLTLEIKNPDISFWGDMQGCDVQFLKNLHAKFPPTTFSCEEGLYLTTYNFSARVEGYNGATAVQLLTQKAWLEQVTPTLNITQGSVNGSDFFEAVVEPVTTKVTAVCEQSSLPAINCSSGARNCFRFFTNDCDRINVSATLCDRSASAQIIAATNGYDTRSIIIVAAASVAMILTVCCLYYYCCAEKSAAAGYEPTADSVENTAGIASSTATAVSPKSAAAGYEPTADSVENAAGIASSTATAVSPQQRAEIYAWLAALDRYGVLNWCDQQFLQALTEEELKQGKNSQWQRLLKSMTACRNGEGNYASYSRVGLTSASP